MKLPRLARRPMRIYAGDGCPPRYPVKELLAVMRSRIYRGDKVECFCCGKTFSLFLFSPYLTARCPYCLSMERYRLLCRYLREETDFGSGELHVLDVAPAWCFQEFCRDHENVRYTSIDIASPMAMQKMDIRDLSFDDGTFDCVICYHVLEHIDDDRKALHELHRVLKPGGWAIVQVPIHVEKTVERSSLSPKEQKEILRWPDHRRAYGKDFAGLLESVGFRVEVVPYGKKFSKEEVKRYGLDPTEDIYLSRKPG